MAPNNPRDQDEAEDTEEEEEVFNRKSKRHKILISSDEDENEIDDEIINVNSPMKRKESPLLLWHKINDLWIDKHIPESFEDILISKRQKQEIEKWLIQPSSRFLLVTGPSGIGKSTCIHVLGKTLNVHIRSWSETSKSYTENKSNYGFHTPYTSDLDDFKRFLTSATRYPSLLSTQRGIILLENWPNNCAPVLQSLATTKAYYYPIVLVYSHDHDQKITVGQLNRLFSTEFVSECTLVQCGSISKTNLKKYLKKTAKREQRVLSPESLTQVVQHSSGDIRHALNMLQFHTNDSERDPFFSDFHMIGKVLYQKEYDLSHSCLDAVQMALYLQENAPHFYTSIDELSMLCEDFSFTDQLLASQYKHVMPKDWTESIAKGICGQSAQVSNQTPMKNSFRPIKKTQFYQKRTEKQENRHQFRSTEDCLQTQPYYKIITGKTQAPVPTIAYNNIVDSETEDEIED